MIKDDGTVIHFNNPKVQASVPANTFSVTGSAETKRMLSTHAPYSIDYYFSELTEMLPGILNQLGAESLSHLKKLASNVTTQYKAGEEEIPGWFLIFLVINIVLFQNWLATLSKLLKRKRKMKSQPTKSMLPLINAHHTC